MEKQEEPFNPTPDTPSSYQDCIENSIAPTAPIDLSSISEEKKEEKENERIIRLISGRIERSRSHQPLKPSQEFPSYNKPKPLVNSRPPTEKPFPPYPMDREEKINLIISTIIFGGIVYAIIYNFFFSNS